MEKSNVDESDAGEFSPAPGKRDAHTSPVPDPPVLEPYGIIGHNSQSSKQDDTRTGLLDLAMELRMSIYALICSDLLAEHGLSNWDPTRVANPKKKGEMIISTDFRRHALWKDYRCDLASIHLVSQQVRQEFIATWASVSVFQLPHLDFPPERGLVEHIAGFCYNLQSFIRDIGPLATRNIRKIHHMSVRMGGCRSIDNISSVIGYESESFANDCRMFEPKAIGQMLESLSDVHADFHLQLVFWRLPACSPHIDIDCFKELGMAKKILTFVQTSEGTADDKKQDWECTDESPVLLKTVSRWCNEQLDESWSQKTNAGYEIQE